jgi:hypothetical protein
MKTKELLNEWKKYMSSELLLEASRDEVIDVIGQEDYDKLTKLNRKASQDQNFLQVIMNTYKANENHSIEDILGVYSDYARFIAPKWNKEEPAKIDVPGGHRASITPADSTYDTILQFTQASHEMTLKTKAYKKCLDQGSANTDFEVIVNDSEWVICYPKSIKGSISLSRSYWDGERLVYDVSFSNGEGSNVGEMRWCTSIVGGGNMFRNYHRKLNLHMYYCIKKSMSVDDEDRKLCISIAKKHGDTSLMTGHASVDADNKVTSEEEFRSYIGSRYDDLFRDAEKPERLEIDEKAYYESISLEQYKVLRAANEDNIEDFSPELFDILQYSRDKEKILEFCVEDKSALIRKYAAHHYLCPPRVIQTLSKDNNKDVRINVVTNPNCPPEVLANLSKDPEDRVRQLVAWNSKCPPDTLQILAKDPDKYVRSYIIKNWKCPIEVLQILSEDPDENIRKMAIKRLNRKLNQRQNQAESILKNYVKLILS